MYSRKPRRDDFIHWVFDVTNRFMIHFRHDFDRKRIRRDYRAM